jgi:hypothetical protein
MITSRILPCVLMVALAVGTGIGCQGGGEGEQTVSKEELVQQLAGMTQGYDALQQARQELEALRSELAELEATPEATRSPEQQARFEELQAEVASRDTANAEAYDDLQTKLASFLTIALNDFPQAPETLDGLRIYSEEAMVYAADAVAKAGDYKKAIDQLEMARGLYEQIGQPVYQPLEERIAQLDDLRFLTQERYDEIAKGMTEDQVKEIAGTPYYRNVKEDPEKKVITWLYPKREGGAAAIYFKMDNRKVYSKNFDAVKIKVGEE